MIPLAIFLSWQAVVFMRIRDESEITGGIHMKENGMSLEEIPFLVFGFDGSTLSLPQMECVGAEAGKIVSFGCRREAGGCGEAELFFLRLLVKIAS